MCNTKNCFVCNLRPKVFNVAAKMILAKGLMPEKDWMDKASKSLVYAKQTYGLEPELITTAMIELSNGLTTKT